MFVTTGRPQIAHAGTKRGPRRGRVGVGARLNVCPLPVQWNSSGMASRPALAWAMTSSIGRSRSMAARARCSRSSMTWPPQGSASVHITPAAQQRLGVERVGLLARHADPVAEPVVEHARARAGRAGERHRQGRTRLAVRLVPVGDRVDLTRLRAVPERREEAPAVAPRADADPLETKRREEGHATLAVLGCAGAAIGTALSRRDV